VVAFAAREQERMQHHEQDGADQTEMGRSHGASVHRAGNQALIETRQLQMARYWPLATHQHRFQEPIL
jgi:hypothetical protein